MDCISFVRRMLHRVVMVGIVCTFLGLVSMPVGVAFAQGTAYVRVIHASPFVGTADVFVDGAKLLSSFQFAAVTDYVPVPSGPHKVQIALVGKGINASVISQTLTVNAGFAYTVAALGATPTTLSLQVFVDNNLVSVNQAKVRVYTLSPDAGTVNVSIGEDASLKNVPYNTASEYYTIGTGPCTFSLTSPQHNSTLPLTTTLAANTITSVFAVGMFTNNPKIQLVSAQVKGIPALPGTGSDPNAYPTTGQPVAPWLFIVVALSLVSIGAAIRLKRRAA